MRIFATLAGILIVAFTLLDTFETVILPRRVKRRFRLTNLFFMVAWPPYRRLARSLSKEGWRDSVLAYFGPSAILILLVVWALGMIGGFALIHWGLGSHIVQMNGSRKLTDDLYLSGTTFFTLGLGDVIPITGAERFVAIVEAGLGLGFLAIVIAYLPVLYQTFSQREVFVNRLDILTGAPPTPGAILRRYSLYSASELRSLIDEWQRWTAELMDSMQSYPVLAFYRSQHPDQSWLTALVAILDTCALIMNDPDPIFEEGRPSAELAFALGSHAAQDICSVLGYSASHKLLERPEGAHHDHILGWLSHRGLSDDALVLANQEIDHLRVRYEEYVASMSNGLLTSLPAFCPICEPEQHSH